MATIADLQPLIGAWSLEAGFHGVQAQASGARAWFEWMTGERFVVQRWEVPIPEAPDGIAIIGPDPQREGGFLQHYFDSRGVARTYKMTLEGGVWQLWRDEPDLSPLDFAQRYTGTFSEDGGRIDGAWEIKQPDADWALDFELNYIRDA
jgi:hypothetical protein